MSDREKDLFSLAGKQVLLTGATGFIGRDLAEALLRCGARVVLAGRSERLDSLVDECAARHGRDLVAGKRLDFYDRAAAEATLRAVAGENEIDVVVNNAYDLSPRTGFNSPDGTLENATPEQWTAAFTVGLYSVALATQVFSEGFKRRGAGNIINVSSMYGLVAPDPALYEGTDRLNPPTYGAMKAGVLAYTRYTASFLGRHGIRCNALVPGAIPNVAGGSANAVSGENHPLLERLRRATALNRVGTPADLRGALIFLASDASAYMTGQALVVDGGWTIR